MDLKSYLAESGRTMQDMATACGRAQSVISRIANGLQFPERTTALSLIEASKGKICICDLYAIPKKWRKCK